MMKRFLALLLALPFTALAQSTSSDLSNSTMEQLTQVQINVNSVSRKDENVWQTAAAVYVITRAQIEASPAENIPDLLRGVPGLQVAQITASTWAVSARGFNSAFANKLLVLIDGRTVYSEIYSGAHWDEIDMPLNNVERIEVIRGPGAAVWGTNAVNGVINIITRTARKVSDPGVIVRFSRTEDFAFLQDGGTLGDKTQYRTFLSYMNRKALDTSTGTEAFDGQSLFRLGARVDWQHSAGNRFSFFGDAYHAHSRQQANHIVDLPLEPLGREHDSISGGFLMGRWEHSGGRSNSELQAYSVVEQRREVSSSGRTITSDYDYLNHMRANEKVDLVWGGELRLTNDAVLSALSVLRQRRYNNYLADGFLQSQITLKPNTLQLTVGSKIQDGSLAGFQLQPSVRLGWSVDPKQFFWGAISRAVVAPSLQDKELVLPLNLGTYGGLPVVGDLKGNPAFKPEEVIAFELGGRRRLGNSFTVDVAGFHHLTRRIQSLSAGTPSLVLGASPYLYEGLLYGNGFSAQSEGVETSIRWKPAPQIEFEANHTWIEDRTHQTEPGQVTIIDSFATSKNTFTGHLHWTPRSGTSFTMDVFRVGSLSSPADVGADSVVVPAYTRLDARLSRKVGSHTSFDVGGTNLLAPRHLEFGGGTTFLAPAVVPRSLFVRAAWSF